MAKRLIWMTKAAYSALLELFSIQRCQMLYIASINVLLTRQLYTISYMTSSIITTAIKRWNNMWEPHLNALNSWTINTVTAYWLLSYTEVTIQIALDNLHIITIWIALCKPTRADKTSRLEYRPHAWYSEIATTYTSYPGIWWASLKNSSKTNSTSIARISCQTLYIVYIVRRLII